MTPQQLVCDGTVMSARSLPLLHAGFKGGMSQWYIMNDIFCLISEQEATDSWPHSNYWVDPIFQTLKNGEWSYVLKSTEQQFCYNRLSSIMVFFLSYFLIYFSHNFTIIFCLILVCIVVLHLYLFQSIVSYSAQLPFVHFFLYVLCCLSFSFIPSCLAA